jgi:hypothetical protein
MGFLSAFGLVGVVPGGVSLRLGWAQGLRSSLCAVSSGLGVGWSGATSVPGGALAVFVLRVMVPIFGFSVLVIVVSFYLYFKVNVDIVWFICVGCSYNYVG